MMAQMPAAGLYIHIPFCRSKCSYCDFCSYAGMEAQHAPYIAALEREMARAAERWPSRSIQTIFVGGGTPTILASDLLERALRACGEHFRIQQTPEITVEANPGTLNHRKLAAMLRRGVNRLSLGVQSLDDALLRRLGRIHSADEAIRSYQLARSAGLGNISLDLMYGLPEQSLEIWRDTLRGVLDLEPDHLSLYALHLDDDVPMARAIDAGACPPPDDDLAADMYLLAMDTLGDAGYNQYEISNWARISDGTTFARCQHNLTYWLDKPYLGLGCAAHGYVDGQRYWNVSSPSEYIARSERGEWPIDGSEVIDARTEMAEFMILGLRLIEGITYRRFAERFGSDLLDVFGDEVSMLVESGLLERDDVGIRLSRGRGYLLGNQVFQEFVATGKDA